MEYSHIFQEVFRPDSNPSLIMASDTSFTAPATYTVTEMRTQITSHVRMFLQSIDVTTSNPEVAIIIVRTPPVRESDPHEVREYVALVTTPKIGDKGLIEQYRKLTQRKLKTTTWTNQFRGLVQGEPHCTALGALGLLFEATCEMMYKVLGGGDGLLGTDQVGVTGLPSTEGLYLDVAKNINGTQGDGAS